MHFLNHRPYFSVLQEIVRQTPIGRKLKGRPKLSNNHQVEQDLITLKMTNWKRKHGADQKSGKS